MNEIRENVVTDLSFILNFDLFLSLRLNNFVIATKSLKAYENRFMEQQTQINIVSNEIMKY